MRVEHFSVQSNLKGFENNRKNAGMFFSNNNLYDNIIFCWKKGRGLSEKYVVLMSSKKITMELKRHISNVKGIFDGTDLLWYITAQLYASA